MYVWKPVRTAPFRHRPAQCRGGYSGHRGETETLDKMQKRVECDHRYIQQWSLWLDIKIILRTFLVVFRQENAY